MKVIRMFQMTIVIFWMAKFTYKTNLKLKMIIINKEN
jgi:hypothetical protein